jgi:hypothetical protein
MRSSFSVVVSRFESSRSCSSTSIESACASSMTTIARRPASRPASRCALRASISTLGLWLLAGRPNSLLIVWRSSIADRAGLKTYAVATSGPRPARKARSSVVFPVPTSPVMQTKPAGSWRPSVRCASPSACLRERKR